MLYAEAVVRSREAYEAFLTEFLARKVKLFGPAAINRAKEIPGLVLHASGRVLSLGPDPLATLEAALLTFEKLSGKVSTINARGIVRQLALRERYPGLELPPPLLQ